MPCITADRATYLFHFYSPHGSTDIDDKQDVFGNWVHVLRSKKVDKISVKHLKDRIHVWAKPLSMFGV